MQNFIPAYTKQWTHVRTYPVRTIFSEPIFLGCMEYYFLPFVLRECASCARELRYYFAQGVLCHFPIPHSISVYASCSWSGFVFFPEVFTFRDLTATFTCQQGEFASFYGNTFMFCVSDARVKIILIATFGFCVLPLCAVHSRSVKAM